MNTPTYNKQVKRFLKHSIQPKTMLQVATETGIFRANICRYLRTFRKRGQIQLIRIGVCPISKHKQVFTQPIKANFLIRANKQH